jgi:hypothetical protein
MNHLLRKASLLMLMVAAFSFGFATQSQASEVSECAAKVFAEGDTAKMNALGRAKNLARQAAESANGGLTKYRADVSMHGRASEAPCVDNGDGSWTFTVKGFKVKAGKLTSMMPTMETVVKVDSAGWKVSVVSNGPIR